MRRNHFLSMAILLCSVNAFATLGEKLDSDVKTENHVAVSKVQSNKFTKQESAQPRLTVHQFAATDGTVFAVAWSGHSHPNLRSLLGTHFADYQVALMKFKAQHKGHGPLQVEVSGLHVEQGGSPRALSGRVWLTDSLPEGVDLNDLK